MGLSCYSSTGSSLNLHSEDTTISEVKFEEFLYWERFKQSQCLDLRPDQLTFSLPPGPNVSRSMRVVTSIPRGVEVTVSVRVVTLGTGPSTLPGVSLL